MEKIIEDKKCCGCYSCVNICPQNAIYMEEDNKGFNYPKIDSNKCINCGMCKKVCPVLNNKVEEEKKIKSYACYNVNLNQRLNSSSGGIFVLLAESVLNKGGVVFGAVFDEKFEVRHSYCENKNDLIKLLGSKYTQSIIGDSYKKVKEFLEEDRYVLFSGTPCQIEGLKAFLKKDYKKLYTQDIICHGVPSPRLWKKYLKYIENKYNQKIENVSFRNKDKGWSLFQVKILLEKKVYSKELTKDYYMQAFLNNICLRDSCYECSFKKKYRNSDITLADYWGVRKIHPEFNDDKGVSLVVINSEKGKDLFDNIKDKLVSKDTNLEKALKYNIAMIKSADHCKNEKKFIEKMDSLKMDKLVKTYVPKPSWIRRVKNIIKKILKV